MAWVSARGEAPLCQSYVCVGVVYLGRVGGRQAAFRSPYRCVTDGEGGACPGALRWHVLPAVGRWRASSSRRSQVQIAMLAAVFAVTVCVSAAVLEIR